MAAVRSTSARRPSTRSALLALALALSLAACSGGEEPPPPDLPAEELYSQGQDLMAQGNFADAAKSFEEVERQLLVQALERTRGNQTHAGQLLGINRDQVRYRIEKFGLEKPQLRRPGETAADASRLARPA